MNDETKGRPIDVLIVGGGPAGATCGTLLKKYSPDLRVVIVERDQFPRDHIGESQLPVVCTVLDEMGVWNDVEAAGFPVKIGATYRWGVNPDLWSVEFLAGGKFEDQVRPAKYEGQRVKTAFQVDRSIYDKILLDHAEKMGCEVYQRHRALDVKVEGDRVASVRIEGGRLNGVQTAKWYVDASATGLVRRALDIHVDYPTTLRNIAIWDYWQNADWAQKVGIGGTRILVLSIGYGWIWFIPLGPTRTSVGLVVPAEHYKKSGLKPQELYLKALQEEETIHRLMREATSEGLLQTTNDWSFLADRMSGANWFLAGDSCGFADPILSAGMTLAHTSGLEVASMIANIERKSVDEAWIKSFYSSNHRIRIGQHIRVGDYWYTANTQFTDLREYTAEIARDAGLDLEPDEAFDWMAKGGFVADGLGTAAVAAYTVYSVKRFTYLFSGKPVTWRLNSVNHLRLNLSGATWDKAAIFDQGRISQVKVFCRQGKRLVLSGAFKGLFDLLKHESDLQNLLNELARNLKHAIGDTSLMSYYLQALEVMIVDGWVTATLDPSRPHGKTMETSWEDNWFTLDSMMKMAGPPQR